MSPPIHILSTTSIRPRKNHHENGLLEKIELTPWDLQFLFVEPLQRGLLFNKSSFQISETNTNLIQHLKATLSSTLDTFYPFAGRLARTVNHDSTSSFSLCCNDEGVQFVHAVADGVSVADILNPLNVPDHIIHSFFPSSEIPNYEGIYRPLLSVQVTELLDGIFIACTINHCVSDGTPFWHFFNTWSQISRGGHGDGDDEHQAPQVSKPPPIFARQYLNGIIQLPLHIPFEIPQSTFTPLPPIFQHIVFHFTKQTISQLKAKANAEMGTDKISSLQALLAHFWLCVTHSRNLKANQDVSLGIMIGMRNRMEPKYLAEEYLGNMCQPAFVQHTAGELLKKGLGWVAWQINKLIDSYTSGEARKLLQDWAKNPIMFKGTKITDNTTLFLGGSHRYNIYGNDFGWGRPIAVRSSQANMRNGKMNVFAGAEQGSIDFEAWLLPETIQAMVNEAEFRDTITV
ncbi:hypothetical protein FEM48_Zijuj02G0082900 [Ziziphus jujuba var. spinosa]|uniref:HXXXD-type acyl-transferase family protein n=1 Tax=Ziziphus jujuba var. spinosa TaxID=714518 RepID=A0A978VUM6_ZIZJJ|nr:uncharacterized acetyltransferase At3g50280-like [Ziziphus jujuba var. spinosa]KAH7542521.1 hypothetical protein FEM48_Zijuj02G0082900 [Ziziphus jujuba var. spinosa]